MAIAKMAALGSICYLLIKKERLKTVAHLRFIFGNEWTDKKIAYTAWRIFINLGKNATDVIRLKKCEDAFFKKKVAADGWKYFETAYKREKGVICLSCHIGAFELLHHYMAWRGYPICVTGTRIYDPRLNDLIVANRLGERISYVERGENSGRQIIRNLREGNLFGVLIDQDAPVEGIFAPFLGHPAFTPSTPVKIAMKTGAAIVPFVIRMQKDRKHQITIEPEIELVAAGDPEKDLLENVTRCNDVISKWIRETPDQWVWMHERWKTKP
jgi:KDO2-lipid IV(A) lauroyltransferase